MFLACLQALASFSWGSSLSSSPSLVDLPVPLPLPFPRAPWPFPRPLALPFPRPSPADKEWQSELKSSMNLSKSSSSGSNSTPLCHSFCLPVLTALCQFWVSLHSKVPGVLKGTRCRGTLSRSLFQTGDASPAHLGCTSFEYLVFGFPVIGLSDNFFHRKFCWRLGETACLPFPRAISQQQFPSPSCQVGHGLFPRPCSL